MTSRSHSRLAAFALLTLLPLVGAGCATKGFVRGEIDELRESTRLEMAGLRSETADLRNSTDEALTRARSASTSADEARDLALGKAGLEELSRHVIYFRFNSDEIAGDQMATLDAAAAEIRDHPEAIVDVYGFADPTGPDRYNLELGQRRASEVVRHLAGKSPHQLSRYAAVSFGERPLGGMETDSAEHARSRRVVVSLIRRIPLNGDAPPVASEPQENVFPKPAYGGATRVRNSSASTRAFSATVHARVRSDASNARSASARN